MDDELLMLLFGQQPLRKDKREYTTFIYYPITDTVTIRLVSELRWKSLEDIISDAKSYLKLKKEMKEKYEKDNCTSLKQAVIKYKRKLEAGEAYNSALICEATKDLFELVNDDKGKVNNE